MDYQKGFIGIDFSGSAARWGPKVTRPTIWIASLTRGRPPVVEWLFPVQDLPGEGLPFPRLAEFLRRGDFAGAGIDAPFSVPDEAMPEGGWAALIESVDTLAAAGRPFPTANAFLRMLGVDPPRKTFRCTERHWQSNGVTVRSTLWWTPRGGAPFSVACMKLIAMAGKSRCWPWAQPPRRGFLVEAFPAAQLQQWTLNHRGYNGDKGAATRRKIVHKLRERVDFRYFEGLVLRSADALDAVLSAFAAMAVATGTAVMPEGLSESNLAIRQEGWIAVCG